MLLVDDDPEVVAATALLLRAWGADVVTATDCAEASKRMAGQAAGQGFDLIVLDQQLPDGQGCDWLLALRQQTFTDVPALLITAEATPALRDAAAAAGAVIAAKPLPALKLRAAVMAALAERAPLRVA